MIHVERLANARIRVAGVTASKPTNERASFRYRAVAVAAFGVVEDFVARYAGFGGDEGEAVSNCVCVKQFPTPRKWWLREASGGWRALYPSEPNR